jgi:hypothetical protein
MVSTITRRIDKLEHSAALYNATTYFQMLSYKDKLAAMRKLYAEIFGLQPLTQEDYETDLLHRFPEVLQPGYKPPVLREEMSKAERFNALLSAQAWHVALERGLTKNI